MSCIEKHYKESRSLTVLIHGTEASRNEWLDLDGYTKGGNLTREIDNLGMSWIACDLYGHGDFKAEEPDFDVEDITDEIWPIFINRSVEAIEDCIAGALDKGNYSSITLVTYSVGVIIGVYLLKKDLPLPVDIFLAAVPTPEKEYDDEYSLHNNLEAFTGRSVNVFFGSEDEDVSFEEARWFFRQIPGEAKKQHVYPSGHSLPVDWVYDAVDTIKEHSHAGTVA